VKPLTDNPERFQRLGGVFIETPAGNVSEAVIANVRFHRGQVIALLEGCNDHDAAESYRGCYISISEDQLAPLEKDSFYIFDLIGCAVYDADGSLLGVLAEVLETGSNDVYVVRPGPPGATGAAVSSVEDILIPALKTVVREVDVVGKRIIVNYNGLYE